MQSLIPATLKIALIAQSSVRYFVQTSARSARTGGFRSNYSEQFAFRSRTVAQPTLRERLLGPTSGKPFIYGTYALAGASVFWYWFTLLLWTYLQRY